jgi:hypothetical protein
MQNLGGTDLTIAVADCKHFKEAVELPKKLWIVFNVPGFYHITEYDVDRILFDQGKLSRLWGTSKHQKDTVYAADFNRTVFFSEEAAKLGLEKLIKEYRNEET